jgi:hypothetical protein
MNTVWIIVATVLIFSWSWWRLYVYNMRKHPNRAIAHMLGFLLGSFPALFFFYACVASFPPPEAEIPSTMSLAGLWGIFVMSIIMVLYLTSRPVPPRNYGKAISSDKRDTEKKK